MIRKLKVVGMISAVALMLMACGLLNGGYDEGFDDEDEWVIDFNINMDIEAVDSELLFTVSKPDGIFWVMAGTDGFEDGTWEVDVRQVSGPEDAGYGLVFRANETSDAFYLLQVSTDGFYWIGECTSDGCEALVGDGWVEDSTIVPIGIGVTHNVRVDTAGTEMTFYINGTNVGSATDDSYPSGDLGLLVETFGGDEDTVVAFDNLKFTPAEE